MELTRIEAPPAARSDEQRKAYRVRGEITCPVCDVIWAMEWHEALKSMRDIQGATGEAMLETGPGGRKFIRLDSSRWGWHALCGTCAARRIAYMADKGIRIACWNDELEAKMHGHLKYQQGRYAARAFIVGPADFTTPLIDEREDRRRAILGRNNTRLDVERAKTLGPEIERWAWNGA